MAISAFGEFFKTRRKGLGLTLRKFCIEKGLDPGNISKLERGIFPPPATRKKLEQYASYLQIKEGSDDWYQFFDLAATSAGKIPPDLMQNEELVKKLPAVFRTLRGQKITQEKLEELAELIRTT